ncbi:MAG: hypothetical protein [Olavius algarvensis Gamma 1 endosymbiont]|nr:MAG: hypothetical protein [Olavius algarvensis Gamma 1 endosymbiont]
MILEEHIPLWFRVMASGSGSSENLADRRPEFPIRVVPVDNFLIYKNIIRLDRPN